MFVSSYRVKNNRSTWAEGPWINWYECPLPRSLHPKLLTVPSSKRPQQPTFERNVPMNDRQHTSTGQNAIGWFRSSSPACIFQHLDNSKGNFHHVNPPTKPTCTGTSTPDLRTPNHQISFHSAGVGTSSAIQS